MLSLRLRRGHGGAFSRHPTTAGPLAAASRTSPCSRASMLAVLPGSYPDMSNRSAGSRDTRYSSARPSVARRNQSDTSPSATGPCGLSELSPYPASSFHGPTRRAYCIPPRPRCIAHQSGTARSNGASSSLPPRISRNRLTPSTARGGDDAPATSTSVGSTSQKWIGSPTTRGRSAAAGHCSMSGTRIPPSYTNPFAPRRPPVDPWAKRVRCSGPLSLASSSRVCCRS
eukprot:scaffold19252_cov117-Isochrysis_galbana.AAC.8